MEKKEYLLLVCILLFSFLSCKRETKKPIIDKEITPFFEYVQNLSVDTIGEQIKINFLSSGDSTVINKKELPLHRALVLSSSAIGYLEGIGSLKSIKGIYDPQYIYSPQVHYLIEQGRIKNMGNTSTANIEQIIAMQPDVVYTYSDPSKVKLMEQIKNMNIPIIYLDEYLEMNPLAKSEYLRLFGLLNNKEKEADSLYFVVKANYNKIKTKVNKKRKKPTVLTNIMRGDAWYMSGGKSFNTTYIEDAGGDFLWKDNQDTGSFMLSFEEVFSKAKNAEYWLNTSNFSTLSQLNESYKNNHLFQAYKNRNVYTYSKRENDNLANDIFETGAVRADWVLKDLVKILHPEILPNYTMYFYQKLK